MSKEKKGWILGAAIGTIVGSVTALLFAPKAGRELRKDIADGARQVGEKTQEVAGKVGEQSVQIADKVKGKAEDLVHEFQTWRASKTESGEEEVQDAAPEELLALQEAPEQVVEAEEPAQSEETAEQTEESAASEAAVSEEADKE